jgi:hypothetical protein
LISLDATGNFSSHKVHCQHCCEKHHKDGTITYHHQTLAAVMVHPKFNTVLPMMIEPITKADGDVKNDCEHNAAKRLLVNLRKQHPDLKNDNRYGCFVCRRANNKLAERVKFLIYHHS